MKRSIKSVLTASMAALCVMGMGMSVNAYELNPEVKDVTPALREASTVGVWTHENPAMKNAPNKDAILVMTFGTTFTDTRHKTIDAVEKAIQEANPNVPVYEAYTSHIIIDRVKAKEGISQDDSGRSLCQTESRRLHPCCCCFPGRYSGHGIQL